MKKFTAKCLIWTLILFMIGLSLLLTAGFAGGFNQLKSSTSRGVNSINIMGQDIPISLNFGKDSYEGSGKSVDLIVEGSANAKKLNLNIAGSDVEVIMYSGQDIKIEGENIDGEISCEMNVSECVITQVTSINNFSLGNASYSFIKIYIPQGIVLDEITADIGAGKFTTTGLTVGEMNFDIGAGDVKIDNAVCDNLDVDCGAGNFVYNGKVNKEANLNVSTGNLEMTMDQFDSYNYKVSAALGNVTLGGDKDNAIGADIEKKHEGANVTINVEVAVGNVDIK